MKNFTKHVTLILTLLLFCNGFCQAHNGKTAYSIPISGITIDGNLDDWPKDMELYPVDLVKTWSNSTLPNGPDDFSASFRVGYNAKENVLYVAVEVRDDDVVVHPNAPNNMNQDGCVIYIDGDHSGGDKNLQGRQMFAMVPGTGKWTSYTKGNPALLDTADIEKSGTKVALQSVGQTTIYEWSIPLFESYPDKRLIIQPGETIGFDLLTAEADGEENSIWVFWTPPGSGKWRNSSLFGSLVFVESYAELGSLTGTITKAKSADPLAGLTMEVYQDNQLITSVKTDNDGNYGLKLLPGEYSISPKQGQQIKQPELNLLTLNAGEEIKNDLNLISVQLPDELKQAATVYKSLKGYQDSTTIEMRILMVGTKMETISPMFFAFERPNRISVKSGYGMMSGKNEVVSNGKIIVNYKEVFKQYTQKDAPQKLSFNDLRSLAGLSDAFVQKVLLNENPQKKLMEGVEEVKQIGREKMGDIPVTVFELTRMASSFAGEMVPSNTKDIPVKMRLWIGKKDFLIRKVEYEPDMEQFAEELPKEQQARMKGMKYFITEKHTHIKVNPEFSVDFFTYVPPEEANLVERFGRQRPKAKESQLIGKPAPDFTLKDIGGNEAKLADFKGKVVLIDFWATWCGPCIKAMPHVQTLYEIYKDKDVVVLGINSWERAKDKVEPFLKEHKITYRILLDLNNEVIKKYGVKGIPSIFIIDKKGTVRFVYTGMQGKEQIIQQNIEELRAE